MEITIEFNAVMPDNIKAAFFKHTGIELEADFNEVKEKKGSSTESTRFGVYFGGDNKDEAQMREEFKSEGRRFHSVYSEGYFTMKDMINAVAFFDTICPKKKQCWRVNNYSQGCIMNEKYHKLKAKYKEMVKKGKIAL